LKDQRESQDKLMDEMISPITQQILPASINERIEVFSNTTNETHLIKESFLNYRLLKARVLESKKTIPAYFLFYSHSEREKISGRIESISDDIGFLNRGNVKIILLSKFNIIADSLFDSVLDINLSIESEIHIRNIIDKTSFSLSPIIIVDKLPTGKIEIEIMSKIYFDERLIRNN